MKATELRIGNLVLCRNEIDKVNGIDISNNGNAIICSDKFGVGEFDIQPIPLTEEWLLKFGFYISGDDENNFMIIIQDKPRVYLDISLHDMNWAIGYVTEWSFPLEITYVHQLQNLYFALTGEELTTEL